MLQTHTWFPDNFIINLTAELKELYSVLALSQYASKEEIAEDIETIMYLITDAVNDKEDLEDNLLCGVSLIIDEHKLIHRVVVENDALAHILFRLGNNLVSRLEDYKAYFNGRFPYNLRGIVDKGILIYSFVPELMGEELYEPDGILRI